MRSWSAWPLTFVLAGLAPGPARAEPASPARPWHLGGGVGLGLRGNEGGLGRSGIRMTMFATATTPVVDVVVTLDRQVGGSLRVRDADGDDARWSEWLASIQIGRRLPIAPRLSVLVAGGASLVGTRVAATDASASELANLGLDAVAVLNLESGALVITVGVGTTVVPIEQRHVAGAATFVLPARVEPWLGLGIGFSY